MNIPQVSKKDIEKILEYAPHTQPKNAMMMMAEQEIPSDVYAITPINELLTLMDTTNFNIIFDYREWLEAAAKESDVVDSTGEYLTSMEVLKNADLLTLRKIMTAQIRAERFSEGHLKNLFESGYMETFLNRLKEVYNK